MRRHQQTTNTIRLGQQELQHLLEQFDQDQPAKTAPDREFVRWSYRLQSIELVIEHGSGNRVTLPVATRNISRGGISVLHSSYVHKDTACEVILTTPNGKRQSVAGTVMRCRHLQGRVHEVGIAFSEQISTKDLLGLDPLNGAYSLERVDPARLHGSALIVTGSDLDRQLLLSYLEETNLLINCADGVEAATGRAQRGCDLIITDYFLGDSTAVDLIGALHEEGIDLPVIVLTSDNSDSAVDTVRMAGASGVLLKPASRERLFQALGEFLHADGDGGPLYSTLSPDDAAYVLLGKFLGDVPRMALDLERSLRDEDDQRCREIVRILAGTAAPLGFEPVSRLAAAAEFKLSSGSLRGASPEIRALVAGCRRIKSKPAA